MKNILVATIGTRDLMLQLSSGQWYNVGDDQMQDGEIIGEQAEVISDLGLGQTTFRDLTQYLLDGIEDYRSRLKPIIIGKLLADQAQALEQVYLIGTDQAVGIPQRKKDTVHACAIIKDWLVHNYSVPVEIITLGAKGENPSNFEQMFRWWRHMWRETIQPPPDQPILLCLKGCVAQTAEAGRISGLSAYGDRIQFFDFIQNTEVNRRGMPSDYTGPILGTNYLWDRTQQQALKLLDRYDYAGTEALLQPYFQQDPQGFKALPSQIKAGIAWNQGQFETFFQRVKGSLTPQAQQQSTKYWQVAYEQAQLSVVRLQQQNTTEAMLSSFRAVEGLLWLWAVKTFPTDVTARTDQYPVLKQSICRKYPQLSSQVDFNFNARYPDTAQLQAKVLRSLLEAAIPQTATSPDFKEFWDKAKTKRNTYSHRLGGLTEREVFNAWGDDIKQQRQWENRILNCLNLITGQSFKGLTQASLFSAMHEQVKAAIAQYQPPSPH
ncbi:MAG: hypothetical protein KME13_17400 [Myxacorys californica WJT36-NPBG1]|jgi:hypothetical protein|nr:hypothetical protein [Myxacorys californica WJT36-NPBG1]